MLFIEITAVSSENLRNLNAFDVQNAELITVKPGGRYNYSCVLNG